jgi:hypothetical protein
VSEALAGVPAGVVEIALGNDAKGADGGEHPAFRAVDLIHTVAFSHRPALTSARQFEILREHLTRVAMVRLDTAQAATVPIDTVAPIAVLDGPRIVSLPHLAITFANHSHTTTKLESQHVVEI